MVQRRPLVMVPGLVCDDEIFEPQAAALGAVGAAAVLVPRLGDAPTLGAMAEVVLAAAPPRFALLGHSMGGYVALEVLRRAPERVTALALADTMARAEVPEQTASRRRLAALVEADGFDAALDALWPAEVAPSRVDDAGLRERFATMCRRLGPEVFLRQQEAIIARPDSRDLLPGVAVPTLVLCGRDDRITPPEESEAMAGAVPGAVLELLEDCGHLSTWERPGAVTAALLRWLAR